MATIVTRETGATAKGSPLTNLELDNNFINLNTYKAERSFNTATTNLAVGWYTIAVNVGDRATAKFILKDIASSYHQTAIFYASHFYGTNSDITVLHQSCYGVTPFRYIRIKEGGAYDGALLQVYVDSASSSTQAFMLENEQSSGWVLKNWIADGTDPGGVTTFANLTNVASQVDLDYGGSGNNVLIITGDIYAGGDTTQYKVWHSGNDGTGSGLDADLLEGLHASTSVSANTIVTRDGNANIYGNVLLGNVIQNGLGSGSVTLSCNDGYGNANIAFNHYAGVPDKSDGTGSSARITSGVDSTTAYLGFQLGNSTTNGTAVVLSTILDMWTNLAQFQVPLKVVGSTEITNSLTVSSSNTTGGGIILADDGDMVDLNTGYLALRFSQGVQVYSGNKTGSAAITLAANGNLTASTGIFTSSNQLRLKTGTGTTGYGVLHRHDGSDYYVLLTNNNDADGTWNSLRPFSVNLSTGYVNLAKTTVNGTFIATESVNIGTGGTYGAGSIYSDANWGMIFRAKQASPATAQYKWSDSADTELMRLATGGNLTAVGQVNAKSAWINNASGDTTSRAQGLTVSHAPGSNFVVGADPGDSLRNTTFVVKGATRPSIISLRNVDAAGCHWDFVADANTSNKLYIQRAGQAPAITVDASNNVSVAGTITHSGLVPTAGTAIDQIYSVTATLTLTTGWQDTSVNASELATGSYVVQVYVNDYAVGGQQYTTYYSGIMSWYADNTNEASSDEIVLHRAGHASSTGAIFLRVLRTATADTSDLKLQIAGTTANTGTSTYTFKFRRLI